LPVDDLGIRVEGDQVTLACTVDRQKAQEKIVLLVGNTKGVARVEDQLQMAQPRPPAAFYTARPGDTFSKIAQQCYGDANHCPQIFEANRPLLKDPDEIYPRPTLRIRQ
jgi:nucleoid-associated protein YgaU